MTPGEMLAVLDDAIHDPMRRGRSAVVLYLTVPRLWGVWGRTSPHGGTMYGYTRRDCKRIRRVILKAAREDATGH